MTKTRSERKGAKMEAKFAKETKAAREEGRKKQKPPWAGLLLPAGMMILAYIGHLYIDVVERRRSAPLKDDIFITSYPRSGNNWARFLLAHLWLYGGAESGDDGGQTGAWEREFDFNSIETVVPDLERGPSRRSFYDFGAPRLFKSHQPYAPEMGARCHETMDPLQCACPNCPPRWRKVLHFVRDGRDAVCSYYHFRRGLQNLDPPDMNFTTFLSSTLYPGYSWAQHVESYLALSLETGAAAGGMGAAAARAAGRDGEEIDVKTVRYEDLHARPVEVLREIAEWAGLLHSPASLQRAVERSGFQRLRRKEEAVGLRHFDAEYPHRDHRWRLTRQGKVGSWHDCFSVADGVEGEEEVVAAAQAKAIFNAMALPLMVRLGYIDGPDW